VTISGQSEETGFKQTDIDATVEGSQLLIAFNVKFLREVLEVIKHPNVALETTQDTAPGVLRPVGDDDFLHVIMPMHLEVNLAPVNKPRHCPGTLTCLTCHFVKNLSLYDLSLRLNGSSPQHIPGPGTVSP